MAKPSEEEARALDEAGPLLRFAAEHVANLDPDLSLAIAEAREAAQNETWSPQTSQRFWTAFARLCGLALPVTTDCLAASSPSAPAPRWLPWRDTEKISIAERSSARFLRAFLALLAIILPLQLYVWTTTNLAKKINDTVAATQTKVVQLTEDQSRLKSRPQAAAVRVDDKGEAFKALAYSIHMDIERIHELLKPLQLLADLGRQDPAKINDDDEEPDPDRGLPADKDWQEKSPRWEDYFDPAVAHFKWLQEDNDQLQERANLITGLIGAFVLPILFGTLGAVAFIIRSTSDQIRDSTFSTSSPIRNVMRVALGALAGVVISLFSDFSTRLSLSPLALAFLSGYGVEGVFSMFDGLAKKFREAI
jgi:hypothetical protein